MKVYLVGGAVRDRLLGLPITERDWVVVGATPEELLQQGFIPVGKSFPVFLHPITREEYALARTEKKIAAGYHGFSFITHPNISLEEDLARRDLTINAMAEDEQGKIIDPFNGQRDLTLRILRHVSAAFVEDPVRVLRIARFAARFAEYRFTIAPETLSLMRCMAERGELDHLVAERIWKETVKALTEKQPVAFFYALHQGEGLGIIFPEIAKLYMRGKTIFCSILMQITRLTADPRVRFAALLSGLAKEPFGISQLQQFCKRLRVPADFQQLAELVVNYHQDVDMAYTPLAVLELLEKCDAFRRPQRFADFLLVSEAVFIATQPKMNVFLPKKILEYAVKVLQDLSLQEIVDSQRDSSAIRTAIHEARLIALTTALKAVPMIDQTKSL